MLNNNIIQKTIVSGLILIVLLLPSGGNGEDDQLTCPLITEVPVGQLIDQTSLTSDKILNEAVKIINASSLNIASANQMVVLVDSCSINNCHCQSSCKKNTTYIVCPSNHCHPDYDCKDTKIKTKISGSVYDCADMSKINLHTSLYYVQFIFESKDPACSAPLVCSGLCYRLACEEITCEPETCQGQACSFAEIRQKSQNITDSIPKITDSNNIISDVFNKRVVELQPLLGNICDIPILKLICLAGGKPEINIILDLFTKSYENINNCKTSNFELEQMLLSGDTGQILLPCQALTPDPLKQCYPNNYYCCH